MAPMRVLKVVLIKKLKMGNVFFKSMNVG